MPAADVVRPVAEAIVGAEVPVRVECWDGSALGPADGAVQLRFLRRRALRHLLWEPNELGFARAFVSGDLLMGDDMIQALSRLEEMRGPQRRLSVHAGPRTAAAVVAAGLRLGALGPRPKPPPEEVPWTRGGRVHTPKRDRAAISHHYDVGNDFYRLVLGESMVYSCAYWEHAPSPDYRLEQAQQAKLDLVARKLGLRPGMKVLDVGCGWGGFVMHAAQTYGVEAVGVTISQQQAAYARAQVNARGLADRVEIRLQDYREIADGPYDAIASIGMAEHVGVAQLPTYAAGLYAQLSPGGRLLNHAISRRPEAGWEPNRTSFVQRYVFPDGELQPIATVVEELEGAGFEVRDVEALREHYDLTLRAWVANLESHWDEAVALSGPGWARVWRLYMAGSALGFASNRLGVTQVLAVKPTSDGSAEMPGTRRELLG
ncbi:MAG: cyclopropane-fatty-acyl-phospholipid synthase family protein [Ornithinimicrobium sp.]